MKKNEWSGMAAMLRSQEAFPCVSLILPVHRRSPERRADPEELKKALEGAKEQLYQACDEATAKSLSEKLHSLAMSIDFVHNKDGVGLFVSPLLSALARFPFPVSSRLMIGDRFELRDVLYMAQFYPAYAVLTISQKEARLLTGNHEGLKEINDKHFPFRFTDDYLYNRSSLGASFGYAMKGFEREETLLKEKRQKTFLKEFNTLLPAYLENGTRLLVAGTERNLLHYAEMVDASLHPAATLHGNFDHHSPEQLGQLALPAIEAALHTENKQLFSRFLKAVDDKMVATGIEAAWKETAEGKGLHLLVEKDYSTEAYLGNDPAVLLFNKPPGTYKALNDAVEELIRLVYEKNGKVSFVENEKLSGYKRVALMLRYS